MAHEKEYSPSGSEILLATDGALECLEWSETGEDGEPLDTLGLYFDNDDKQTLRAELEEFILNNSDDLDGIEYEQIGHDFILTRNHHGAGFWDRGLGERGERLTKACDPYGSIHAYVSDDGDSLRIEF